MGPPTCRNHCASVRNYSGSFFVSPKPERQKMVMRIHQPAVSVCDTPLRSIRCLWYLGRPELHGIRMSSQMATELNCRLTRLGSGSALTANHLLPTARTSLAPRPARVRGHLRALMVTLPAWHLRLLSAERVHTIVSDHCSWLDVGMHVPLAFMLD